MRQAARTLERMTEGVRAQICFCALQRNMRTTIELPDPLFRRAKATAALRGTSLKDLVVTAIEREVAAGGQAAARHKRRMRLPLVRLEGGRRLDSSEFNFDDLLA